jgi:hypothetical protein
MNNSAKKSVGFPRAITAFITHRGELYSSMSVEEVTTYSGLVRILRERIASYVREGVERARALRGLVRLVGEPIEVEGRHWRGSVGAADGGSSILSFADRDVGFISAITVVDDGGS